VLTLGCPAPATLSLSGSTTLHPVMSDLDNRYADACPNAQI
jgi:ABC-type phosphate transport system substrate-binding protein